MWAMILILLCIRRYISVSSAEGVLSFSVTRAWIFSMGRAKLYPLGRLCHSTYQICWFYWLIGLVGFKTNMVLAYDGAHTREVVPKHFFADIFFSSLFKVSNQLISKPAVFIGLR